MTEPAGYLDFARFGPPPPAVLRAVDEATCAAAAAGPSTVDDLHAGEETARAALRRLSGHEHVVLAPNTSTGLFHAAFGVRGTVLVSPAEFPANVLPWRRAETLGRITVAELSTPDGFVTPEAVRAALTPEVTTIACSAVDSRTGYRADLAALREVIGERLLVVDAIQGFGAADEPWQVADVLACGGQKWLRAGWSTGFLALSARAADRLEPVLGGWTGAFTISNANPVAAAGFAAALTLVEQAGVASIEQAVTDRVERLGALLPGARIPPRHAGIVPVPVRSGALARELLAAEGITVTAREREVRLSVHAHTEPAVLGHAAGLLRGLPNGG